MPKAVDKQKGPCVLFFFAFFGIFEESYFTAPITRKML